MKRREVIVGKTIASIIFTATLCIHIFIVKLPLVYVVSLIIFSVFLFFLCLIGDKKRKKQDEDTQQNK